MKKVDVQILCDTCEKDISPHVSGCPAEYILHVQAQDIAQHKAGQAIYSVMVYPPIDNDLYFCGIGCMQKYNPVKDKK